MSATPAPREEVTAVSVAAEHVVPDLGEIGCLPSRLHWRLRAFGSLGCQLASLLFLVLLVAGVPKTATANNALAGCMMGFWMAANLLRRLVPLLWTEPGKLTYTRIPSVTSVLVPPTLPGWLVVVSHLADIVLLPLALAFAAFHSVFIFSLFGIYLYPPASGSAAPMIVFSLLFGLFGVAAAVLAYGVVLPFDRLDPFQYDVGNTLAFLPKVSSTAAVVLSVPVMTWSCAAIACDGDHMKFTSGARCQGAGHHAFMISAMIFVFLASCLSEMGVGFVRNMREPSAIPLHKEPRNDAFFMEMLLALRWFVVIVASLSTHAASYVLVAGVSGALLWYVWSGRSSYVPSSVRAVKDLYMLLLTQVFIHSLFIFTLVCLGLGNWIGVVVWLMLWLVSVAACAAVFHRRNGWYIFAPSTFIVDPDDS